MNEHNPYKPPSSDLTAESASGRKGGFTPLMVQYLSETKLWVRLISILLFIGTGLMLIVGVSMTLVMTAGTMASNEGDTQYAIFTGVTMGFIYLIGGALYLPPGLYLHRYANAIESTKRGGGAASIESALLHQKSFWRFIGIIAIVFLSLTPVIMIIAIVTGIIVGVSGSN